MQWIGPKRVAFIPTYRPRAFPPDNIPPDWADLILRRVLFDPAPITGADRSFRAWLRAASSGVADINPAVLPMQTIDQQDVPPAVFEAQLGPMLREQGFDHAAIVMLGGVGAGTNSGFWSRFVMLEGTGIWVMEVVHGITGFKDLYPFANDVDPANRAIGTFDEMCASTLTHPTAYTKAALGWIDPATIAQHIAGTAAYQMQLIGLPQRPATGRAAALRIGGYVPYMMLEARKMNDQFEAGLPPSIDASQPGIGSEGVIAYRVQTTSLLGDRQNKRLPLYLLTQQALQVGQSATLDDGVIVSVTGATPDGFAVRIEDPVQHLVDRTAHVRAAVAASAPTSCVLPAAGVENIAYRDAAGHLHELWRDASSVGTTDLTANAQAPRAKGNPFAYVDPTNNNVILLYRGTDNHVHCLYWSTGAVGHDNLTGSVNAPKTAGDPAGWFTPDNVHHVVYRTANGHLRELWWSGPDAVQHGDLTQAASALPAAGDPSCYFDPVRGTNIVAFRATDKRIRSLWWSNGPVGQDDLSGFAGTQKAAGDPCAYFSGVDDTHHIVYRTLSGRIVELFARGVAPVAARDLTALAGAPAAADTPAAGYNPASNTHHVFYRSADGTLHEIWRQVGSGAATHQNLSATYGAPEAVGRPTYWVTSGAPRQHVAYRGADGHIYELRW